MLALGVLRSEAVPFLRDSPFAPMRTFFLFAVVAGLAGCATPYQREGYSGGFTETWQSERSLVVSFSGNAFTSQDRVERYATLRAAELALERGFSTFRIASGGTDVTTTRSGSILTGGVRTSRRADTQYTVVLLDDAEARTMEREGVPIVDARFYIRQNAPPRLRQRLLGE